MMATRRKIEEAVALLARMATRDGAGVHFTRRFAPPVLAKLERAGLIRIDRPVDLPIRPSERLLYWSVEVTAKGLDLMRAFPQYLPPGYELPDPDETPKPGRRKKEDE